MPEGDALHRIAQRLQPLVGERVEASSPHPRGRATGAAAAVDGRRLESVRAVGKHLLLRFEGGIQLRSQLRMSGRWRLLAPGEEPLGDPWLVLRTARGVAAQWNGPVLAVATGGPPGVGPDLLGPGADPRALARRLREVDPSTPLAVVLQDQRLIAGIGNLWTAEALWQHRLSPHLPVGRVEVEVLVALLGWARDEMLAAVSGRRPPRAVYRRARRPCPRCGTPIRSQGVGEHNRTAYWCPACQPEPGTPG